MKCRILLGLTIAILFAATNIYGQTLVAVEGHNDSVMIINLRNGIKQGQLKVGFLPHEICYDKNTNQCFITNFGLEDYDLKIGRPGFSIAVINPLSGVYKRTIYTTTDTLKGNGPHGIKIRPGHSNELFTNVEIGGDSMFVYDIKSYSIKRKFSLPKNSHNFIFSEDGLRLWVMAGTEGVFEIDPNNGTTLHHQTFSSPIRGLHLVNNSIIASGKNEVFLLDKNDLSIKKQFPNLGVGQIFYSNITEDQKYILCPVARENIVLVIDAGSGNIIHKIQTRKTPLNIQIANNVAYVSHPEDNFITTINLKNFTASDFLNAKGTNGLIIIQ